jgi:ribonuclease HI
VDKESWLADGLLVIYADGGSRGNPGPAGAGAYLTVDGQIVAQLSKFIGVATNNVAEYTGLLIGLEKALEMGYRRVEVRMDSELIVKQMIGVYKVKNENLQTLFRKADTLATRFSEFKIVHVRRAYNKDADRLANQAMDLAGQA